ncbi:MAG: flagellar FlbD family protein [Bacillota bacterium]|jgi:flagellar protein FlbD
MIKLTKMNNEDIFINPNLVEIAEKTPDTLISMLSGRKYYVMESAEEVSKIMTDYYMNINTFGKKLS